MKPSVAIYCSRNTLGAFDEDSLEKGVGGSETNLITLARHLGENGHTVTVFNDTEETKRFGSFVEYRNKRHAAENTWSADVWVVWRNPEAIREIRRDGLPGRRYVLWLHDLVPETEVLRYSELYDAIWVQSLFHRSNYPNVPEEKFVVCPSGISVIGEAPKPPFCECVISRKNVDSLKNGRYCIDCDRQVDRRDPNLVCYTSDYVRGLDVLLDIWPNYLFRYPDSRLVVAYGTQTQEALAIQEDERRGDTMASKAWQYRWRLLEKRMAARGVTHMGKLSKRQLADLYETASLMAYPSVFPETQCMVVLDAQSHGCVPVTTSLGALQETASGGYQLPPDMPVTGKTYLNLLIAAREQVTEGRRQACRSYAGAYTWESLYPRVASEILGA